MNTPGQGRKSKPTHLKLLKGEKHRDRINDKEPKPIPKRPTCPRFLTKQARKMWKYLAPQLERTGQLTRVDLGVFAAFCQAYGRWVEAEKFLGKNEPQGYLYKSGEKVVTRQHKDGSVTTTRTGGMIMTNPMLWVANKAIEQFHKLGSSMGLDPASRSRIRVEIEREEDEFEDLLD